MGGPSNGRECALSPTRASCIAKDVRSLHMTSRAEGTETQHGSARPTGQTMHLGRTSIDKIAKAGWSTPQRSPYVCIGSAEVSLVCNTHCRKLSRYSTCLRLPPRVHQSVNAMSAVLSLTLEQTSDGRKRGVVDVSQFHINDRAAMCCNNSSSTSTAEVDSSASFTRAT